jgi:ornithine cyclodeaminase
MSAIYTRAEIEALIRPADVVSAMERAFVSYSQGRAVVPPVGRMEFHDPPGDCHIKYGYIRGDDTFTVKIATGFWRNPERGLASSNGVVLVFSSQTGELLATLYDEGFLTDIRTAAAGAVAAKYLAPSEIKCIGIVGAGIQAHLQLAYLKTVTDCRKATVWARSPERARAFQVDSFRIQTAASVRELLAECNLVVTTTPSQKFLIAAEDVRPGTHITAIGADGGGKQELDPDLFSRAAIRAVDSREQCALFGDSSFAIEKRLLGKEDLVELGNIIEDTSLGRADDAQITIADLTGVAVQDIEVAKLALKTQTRARERS